MARNPVDVLPRVAMDSRRHILVRALRDAIVRGDLLPGDRLVERDISERTGVSRGPVREALRQLEQEGLITSVPYTRTYVTGISQAEVDEILVPVRLVLERFAFRQVLPILTEGDFAQLADLVAEMDDAATAEDLARLVEIDLEFHQKIVERAGTHCHQVWQSIAPRVRACFYRDGYRHASLADLPREHASLLEAMRTKEADRVLPLLDDHIQEAITLGSSEGKTSRPDYTDVAMPPTSAV